MKTTATLQLSIVIATYNRRDVVLETLRRLGSCGLDRARYEVIVVDNASGDGTVDAAAAYADQVIRLDENAGSCAKADGVARARGEFILFLDDDSYPIGNSVSGMLEHFAGDRALGAAGFTVHLPDGQQECGALVDVFVGCGVGLRAEALRQAGGLDRSFFMQAEEYDLAFRLAHAGWRVRVFDDLHVRHEKTARSRKSERTTYYDVRNNLRVVARHLPDPLHEIYRDDLLQRYKWLATHLGHERAYARGVMDGRLLADKDRRASQDRRPSVETLDHFFAWRRITSSTVELARHGVREVVFADLGKNVYAFFEASRCAGIRVLAVGDDRFAAPRRRYRDVPILPLGRALDQACDAIIVSNCAPVFAEATGRRVTSQCCKPVFQWFGPAATDTRESGEVAPAPAATDKRGVEAVGTVDG